MLTGTKKNERRYVTLGEETLLDARSPLVFQNEESVIDWGRRAAPAHRRQFARWIIKHWYGVKQCSSRFADALADGFILRLEDDFVIEKEALEDEIDLCMSITGHRFILGVELTTPMIMERRTAS